MPSTLSDTIRVGALSIRFVLDAEASDGRATAFECDVPANAAMSAPHSHDGFEETIQLRVLGREAEVFAVGMFVGQVGVEGGGAVAPGCVFDLRQRCAGFDEVDDGVVLAHRFVGAAGNEGEGDNRGCSNRAHSACTRVTMRALTHLVNNTEWNSWLRVVNRSGSK